VSVPKLHIPAMMVALLATSSAFFRVRYPGSVNQADAASAQQKAQARQSLDQVMRSLHAVDTAYASGNSAEAKTRFQQARSDWSKVSAVISAREAQLLFDSLSNRLESDAPATQVSSTVAGMLDELREDIEAELR
jgi:aminoglycoside phosphotransferase (APT) family kinase protein